MKDNDSATLSLPHDDDHSQLESSQSVPSNRMVSRCSRLACSVGCFSCLLIVGIVCLALGVQGFFTFHDPCVGVYSLTIKDLDLGSNGDATSSNALWGFLDSITGGAASDVLPTTATMTLEMIMEVNNTNPYDLDYEQREEGTIVIPATSMESSSDNNDDLAMSFPPESDADLVIGTWKVPEATLKKKARNEIPVTITTEIDLLGGGTFDLAGRFMSGGAFLFRVKGGIEGSSWVPGMTGKTSFLCLARLDNILNFGEDANVKCRHSTKVGNLVNNDGDLDFRGVGDFMDDEEDVDPACLV
ncbi:expressed unknown protein [Seminavis robusta]|uniref:Uncharacterized protein n=1 Tax=Seminavis robusta TaxID=568900 RepID=A0A9N8HIW5_9STRA|nr:expressed unknown protein [Seminavis robusta]|eukprot:Sro621_g176750.1 n/a (301) ;mRNA; f:21985-22975